MRQATRFDLDAVTILCIYFHGTTHDSMNTHYSQEQLWAHGKNLHRKRLKTMTDLRGKLRKLCLTAITANNHDHRLVRYIIPFIQ